MVLVTDNIHVLCANSVTQEELRCHGRNSNTRSVTVLQKQYVLHQLMMQLSCARLATFLRQYHFVVEIVERLYVVRVRTKLHLISLFRRLAVITLLFDRFATRDVDNIQQSQ